MVCLACASPTNVVNSRLQKRSNQVWRRRLCSNCSMIFTTEEVVDYDSSWRVESKSNKLLPFSRDRLLLSLYSSCSHRRNALSDASALVSTIIRKLSLEAESGVLSSDSIKQITLVTLNRFDKVASVHYQAHHP